MNEPVKKLFSAPWAISRETAHKPFLDIFDSDNFPIATDLCTDYAHWLVHLPELYDALLEAVWQKCYHCIGKLPLSTEAILEKGCPKERNGCVCLDWIDLLQKIRNQE